MATNTYSQFTSDIENFIADELLEVAQRQLVVYQFGKPLTLPKNRGVTYTAVRYNRVPLPFTTLSEGVPPVGQTMTLTTVSATAAQWGDKITLTDVAALTIKHPLIEVATDLLGLQTGETLERNTFNALMAGTQVNYVNQRGSRASLQAGDVLDPTTVNRTVAALKTLGAPMYMGQTERDAKIAAENGGDRAAADPRRAPHYVAVVHPLVAGDFSQNSTVVTAWSYSQINKLYNAEVGEWRGMRFCESNMVPSFVGVAAVQGTAGTAGALSTNSYFIQVTGSDTQNQYESRIYQVSNSISVTGPTGSISVTTPSTAGFTYSVYIGTTSSPTTLALSASGPTVGPMAGQAVQLPASTTVVLTGVGTSQTPPAAPTTGVTVYPTFVFGVGAYGIVKLDGVETHLLANADKSDPNNQLRVISWKIFYGTILLQSLFMARIESSAQFTSSFG